MADFTREDIAYYQAAARAAEALPEDTNVTIDASDLLRLLSMAERAVSEETVRKLAVLFEAKKDAADARANRRGETVIVMRDGAVVASERAFDLAVRDDLRPAAARLAAKGGG